MGKETETLVYQYLKILNIDCSDILITFFFLVLWLGTIFQIGSYLLIGCILSYYYMFKIKMFT